MRVDTLLPDNATIVAVWTDSNDNGPLSTGPASGPGISKVSMTDIVGEVVRESA